MNILVLCTGNSARSILLESILNHQSAGRVTAFSAGSKPVGQVNPGAIRLLSKLGHDTSGFRSKSWDEFGADDAPVMDAVITVCGSAAGEECPMWPGAPLRSHWGVEDPAHEPEDKIDAAFQVAYDALHKRAEAFLDLPFEHMDRDILADELRRIGTI